MQEMPAMQEMQETQVQSLGWEDPPVEKMAIYSSILAWEIPWTEETAHGVARVGHDLATKSNLIVCL